MALRSPYSEDYSVQLLCMKGVIKNFNMNPETGRVFFEFVKNLEDTKTSIEDTYLAIRKKYREQLTAGTVDMSQFMPAYEQLFLYTTAKRNLSRVIGAGDVKAILAVMAALGSEEGYQPKAAAQPKQEITITIKPNGGFEELPGDPSNTATITTETMSLPPGNYQFAESLPVIEYGDNAAA